MAYRTFQTGVFTTQGGASLDLELVYQCYGQLTKSRDNAIVVLTSYAAQHDEAEALFAASDILDLSAYCVIVINMFCNGLSSSPSNAPPPWHGSAFPNLTIHDNVTCQRRLLDHLGVRRIRLVMGYSMGALQTYEWATQHADMVDAILPICGAAKVSPHNHLFLAGAKAALTADSNFDEGDYAEPPRKGLLAFGQVYAGWVFSQRFFREELHRQMGLETLEEVVEFIQTYFMRRDANDLLGMLWTWQYADISQNDLHSGNFVAALQSITAKAIVMPSSTDLYFRVADSEVEVKHMRDAELRPIVSAFGHVTGSGSYAAGKVMIDQAITELLTL